MFDSNVKHHKEKRILVSAYRHNLDVRKRVDWFDMRIRTVKPIYYSMIAANGSRETIQDLLTDIEDYVADYREATDSRDMFDEVVSVYRDFIELGIPIPEGFTRGEMMSREYGDYDDDELSECVDKMKLLGLIKWDEVTEEAIEEVAIEVEVVSNQAIEVVTEAAEGKIEVVRRERLLSFIFSERAAQLRGGTELSHFLMKTTDPPLR